MWLECSSEHSVTDSCSNMTLNCIVTLARYVMLSLSFFPALVDVTNLPEQESPPIDIFAVGFEEIVDLNASNIMAAR